MKYRLKYVLIQFLLIISFLNMIFLLNIPLLIQGIGARFFAPSLYSSIRQHVSINKEAVFSSILAFINAFILFLVYRINWRGVRRTMRYIRELAPPVKMNHVGYIPLSYEKKTGSIDILHVDSLIRWMRSHRYFCLVIKGEFGVGKTTMLDKLALSLFQKKGRRYPIPLFIKLGGLLVDNVSMTDKDKAWEILQKTLQPCMQSKHFEDNVLHYLKKGPFVLLLDGFDEMLTKASNDEKDRAIELIMAFLRICPRAVISSRPHYLPSKEELTREITKQTIIETSSVRTFQLKGFSKEQIDEYIRTYVSGGTYDNPDYTIDAISKIPGIYEIGRTPFLLYLVLSTYPIEHISSLRYGSLGIKSIYDNFVKKWMKNEVRTNRLSEKEAHDLVESKIPKLAKKHYEKGYIPAHASSVIADTIIDKFSLFHKDDKKERLFFIHPSFWDYFVAKYIHNQLQSGEMSSVNESHWKHDTSLFLRYFLNPIKDGPHLVSLVKNTNVDKIARQYAVALLGFLKYTNASPVLKEILLKVKNELDTCMKMEGDSQQSRFLANFYRDICVALARLGETDPLHNYVISAQENEIIASANLEDLNIYFGGHDEVKKAYKAHLDDHDKNSAYYNLRIYDLYTLSQLNYSNDDQTFLSSLKKTIAYYEKSEDVAVERLATMLCNEYLKEKV